MFKWLDKVIPGKNAAAPLPATEPLPELLPPALATPAPARSAKPVEEHLAAPTITAEQIERQENYEDSVLARKVIVDRAYHPVAYEFSRRPDSAGAGENEALLLIRLLARLGPERLSATRLTWVRLADSDLFQPEIGLLPADRIVLLVNLSPRDAADADRHLQAAIALRGKGFRIALANWAPSAYHAIWLPFCSYVEVSVEGNSPMEISDLPARLAGGASGLQIVATHVDSYEDLEFCHRARFHFFRGGFLTNREHWPRQPKVNPERARICQLLNQLHKGTELSDIAEHLRQSPELSYRLLRYINSPGVGLLIPVASVQQGLVVLGRDKTYRWLTVLLFSSGQGRSIDTALLEQALVRARIMEMLAQKVFNRVQLDELFTVGIFSLLDLLFKLPMSVALEPIKLPPEVRGALVDETGIYAPWLRLAALAEGDDGSHLRAVVDELGLGLVQVNNAQLEALRWMQEVLSE